MVPRVAEVLALVLLPAARAAHTAELFRLATRPVLPHASKAAGAAALLLC